jgi:WD40 repeat protein
VLTASEDGTARLWHIDRGAMLSSLVGHTRAVVSAVFSADGKRVLTASDDGTARLWDASSGATLATLVGHTNAIESAVFSFDGLRMLTASGDGTARVWDAGDGAVMRILESPMGSVRSAVFSADGRRVLTDSLDGTQVLETESGAVLKTLKGVWSWFNPDGRRVLSASDGGTARLWDVDSESPPKMLEGHRGRVRRAVFSADGRRVLTVSHGWTAGSSSPEVRLWDAETGALLKTLHGEGLEGVAHSAEFSGDGHRVVAAFQNTTALWSVESGALKTLEEHRGAVRSAVFSRDGRRVLSASDDGTARVWDAESGAVLKTLQGHTGPVESAVFSFDGRRVLTASRDMTARLWDAKTGATLRTLEGHTGAVQSAVLSGDERRVLTASEDGTARLWDIESGTTLFAFVGHTNSVTSAIFSRDERRVLTISFFDKTARIWRNFTTTQALVDHAKSNVPRCFTPAQLRQFYLPTEPASWCIIGGGLQGGRAPAEWRPKWPFDAPPWRAWLAARNRGEKSNLPDLANLSPDGKDGECKNEPISADASGSGTRARMLAAKNWQNEVRDTYGARFMQWERARASSMECERGVIGQKCIVAAVPCSATLGR